MYLKKCVWTRISTQQIQILLVYFEEIFEDNTKIAILQF